MKKNSDQSQKKQPNNPAQQNRNRPENKDNLDSREGLEQDVKGTDMTHNKKEHRSEPRSGHRGRK
jgi:hypothetical protein